MSVFLGLMISAKGWCDDLLYHTGSDSENIKWKGRLYYLEMPIHIGYKYAVNDRVKLLAGIDPYVARRAFRKEQV